MFTFLSSVHTSIVFRFAVCYVNGYILVWFSQRLKNLLLYIHGTISIIWCVTGSNDGATLWVTPFMLVGNPVYAFRVTSYNITHLYLCQWVTHIMPYCHQTSGVEHHIVICILIIDDFWVWQGDTFIQYNKICQHYLTLVVFSCHPLGTTCWLMFRYRPLNHQHDISFSSIVKDWSRMVCKRNSKWESSSQVPTLHDTSLYNLVKNSSNKHGKQSFYYIRIITSPKICTFAWG